MKRIRFVHCMGILMLIVSIQACGAPAGTTGIDTPVPTAVTEGAPASTSTIAAPTSAESGSTQPESLLIGKWQNDSTGQIIEFTEDTYILYDFPAPNNKLNVKYSLLNDRTIQLDLKDSVPFEFTVNEDTFVKSNQDGTVSTYSRIDSP